MRSVPSMSAEALSDPVLAERTLAPEAEPARFFCVCTFTVLCWPARTVRWKREKPRLVEV